MVEEKYIPVSYLPIIPLESISQEIKNPEGILYQQLENWGIDTKTLSSKLEAIEKFDPVRPQMVLNIVDQYFYSTLIADHPAQCRDYVNQNPQVLNFETLEQLFNKNLPLFLPLKSDYEAIRVLEQQVLENPQDETIFEEFIQAKAHLERQTVEILSVPLSLQGAIPLFEEEIIPNPQNPRHFRKRSYQRKSQTLPEEMETVTKYKPKSKEFEDHILLDYEDYARQKGKMRWINTIEMIGTGGYADVYTGWDLQLDKPVAIKDLREKGSTVQKQRFEAEAKIMTRLDHPGIIKPIALQYSKDRLFLIEEYLDPAEYTTLRSAVSNARHFSMSETATIISKAAEAVDYLHSQNIHHLDIKPSNIFCDFEEIDAPTDTTVKIGDFGIAAHTSLRGNVLFNGFSESYSPPEFLDKKLPTSASDVYSLAATAFFLLFKFDPFDKNPEEMQIPIDLEADTTIKHGEANGQQKMQKPSDLDIVKEKAFIFLRQACAKDPALRPQTAREFADQLAQILKEGE